MATNSKANKTDYGKKIKESLGEWKHIREHGASDPFWCDGVNMNLVRNHVIYYKRMCEEQLKPEEYPAEYFLETPPEVDRDFMARPEEIRTNAKKSLEIYLENDDYRYLLRNREKLTDKQQDSIHIANVIGYVSGLRSAIRNDDIIVMRRHERAEAYLESFQECRRKVAELIGALEEPKEKVLPTGQLSLFDLFGLTMGYGIS